MIILSTLSLLISNAVSLRRDMRILYVRIVIITLLYAILQSLISFPIISNSGICTHGIGLYVTNIPQVLYFYLVALSLFVIIDLKFNYLYSLCISSKFYKHICILTPAGVPLIFIIPFLVIYIIKNFYKDNKSLFNLKNYVFIHLDKIKLCLVLYMFLYITIVLLPIFYLNGSFSISIKNFYLYKVELLALFLSIFLIVIGFLHYGIIFMIELIY